MKWRKINPNWSPVHFRVLWANKLIILWIEAYTYQILTLFHHHHRHWRGRRQRLTKCRKPTETQSILRKRRNYTHKLITKALTCISNDTVHVLDGILEHGTAYILFVRLSFWWCCNCPIPTSRSANCYNNKLSFKSLCCCTWDVITDMEMRKLTTVLYSWCYCHFLPSGITRWRH